MQTIIKFSQIAAVPFVFFCIHAAIAYKHYESCRSNIFVVFLFDNARSCNIMENAMQLMEKAMWCYAIAIVKDLKSILSWVYRPPSPTKEEKDGDGDEAVPGGAIN